MAEKERKPARNGRQSAGTKRRGNTGRAKGAGAKTRRTAAQEKGTDTGPGGAADTSQAETTPADTTPADTTPADIARDYLDLWQRHLTQMMGGDGAASMEPLLRLMQAWQVQAWQAGVPAQPPMPGFGQPTAPMGQPMGQPGGMPWWLAPWAAAGAPFDANGPFPSTGAGPDTARGRDDERDKAGTAATAAASHHGGDAMDGIARRLAQLESRLDDIAATLERLERAGGKERSGRTGRRPRS